MGIESMGRECRKRRKGREYVGMGGREIKGKEMESDR